MAQEFNWDIGGRGSIRYGNLSPWQIAALPAQVRARLYPDQRTVFDGIVDAQPRELTLADQELRAMPGSAIEPATPIHQPQLYSSFNNLTLNVNAVSQRVLEQPPGRANRVYLFIINTAALQNLFLTFQVEATVNLGIPILANFGFIEFNNVVPQDDVYLIANGANTTGVLLFSNKTPD